MLQSPGTFPDLRTVLAALILLVVFAPGARCGPPTENVRSHGAVGDGVTDDTDAFNSAAQALANRGGGMIFIPCGDYRLGKTGPNKFTSGLRITHSNMTVRGEGDCSTLLPGFDWGGAVITVCSTALASSCPDPHPIRNIRFEDFRIHDDDPIGHCQGRGSVCEDSEETHGIVTKAASDVTVRNVTFVDLGDESLDIGAGTSNLVAELNRFEGCPSVKSGGSCLSVSGSSNVLIEANVFQGGISGAPFGANKIIDVAANTPGADTVGVVITGNTILEQDPVHYARPVRATGENWTDTAIAILSNQANVRDVLISDNLIVHDVPSSESITSGGASFVREDIRILGNEIRGSIRVTASDLVIAGNDISGGFGPDGEECSGGTIDFGDTDRPAVSVGGERIDLADNTISGHKRSCVFVMGGTDIDIERNECIGTSGGTPGEAGTYPVITAFMPTADSISNLRVVDNLIDATWSLGTDGVCTPDCASRTDVGECDTYTGAGILLSDIDSVEVVGNQIRNVGGTGIRSGGLVQDNEIVNAGLWCGRSSPVSDVGIALAHQDTGAPETPGASYGFEDAGEEYNSAPRILDNLISGANEGCLEHDGTRCLRREVPRSCVALQGLDGPWFGAEIRRNFFEGCDTAILEYTAEAQASRVAWAGSANIDNNPTPNIHDPDDYDVPASSGDLDLHELGLTNYEAVDRRGIEAAGMRVASSCVPDEPPRPACGLGAELALALVPLQILRGRRRGGRPASRTS